MKPFEPVSYGAEKISFGVLTGAKCLASLLVELTTQIVISVSLAAEVVVVIPVLQLLLGDFDNAIFAGSVHERDSD